MKVVDFHTHILPGIDDGSRSPEMTAALLRQAAKQGIEVMVATPHYYADEENIESFLKRRLTAYESVGKEAEEAGIRLIMGAEVRLVRGVSRLKELNLLRIRGTNMILVEMPDEVWTDEDFMELRRMQLRGIQPVIAHLEYYFDSQRGTNNLIRLLKMQLYIQVNAEALIQLTFRKKLFELFETGNAHILGSDCHDDRKRPVDLKKGRQILEKHLGEAAILEMDRFANEILHLI